MGKETAEDNDKERETNYDLFFSPTTKTLDYYKSYAQKLGMVIKLVEVG